MATGELNPVVALAERRVDFDGDVLAIVPLAEMFSAIEFPEVSGSTVEVDAADVLERAR
jgi:hypothetical protein